MKGAPLPLLARNLNMGQEWMLLDEVMVLDFDNMELMELVGLLLQSLGNCLDLCCWWINNGK